VSVYARAVFVATTLFRPTDDKLLIARTDKWSTKRHLFGTEPWTSGARCVKGGKLLCHGPSSGDVGRFVSYLRVGFAAGFARTSSCRVEIETTILLPSPFSSFLHLPNPNQPHTTQLPTMTLYYSLVFALLVFEMVVFMSLIIPMPFSWKRKLLTFISENPVIAKLQYWIKVCILFLPSHTHIFHLVHQLHCLTSSSNAYNTSRSPLCSS
jgi:hypothetical protein